MTYQVFVSHSHFDTDFCVRLVDGLYSRLDDADIFFDRTDIGPGDRFLDVIQREVLARPIFVVILSPRSVIAPWVRTETSLALYEAVKNPDTRWVMPVKYKECRPRDLAAVLELRHFTDCISDEELGFDKLAQAIRGTSPDSNQSTHWLPPTSQRNPATAASEDALRAGADVHDAFTRGMYTYVVTVGGRLLSRGGYETDADLNAEVGYALLKTANGQLGLIQAAVEKLTTAVAIGPQRPDFLSWKAQACAQSGEIESAYNAWDDALANTSSRLRKIAIFAEKFEAAQLVGPAGNQIARDCADMAVQFLASTVVESDFQYGWLYWADMCAMIGYYERALEALEHELAAHPNDSVLLQKQEEWREHMAGEPDGVVTPSPEDRGSERLNNVRGTDGKSDEGTDGKTPPQALELARQRALVVLVEVVGALTREQKAIDFPMTNARLQGRGVRYRELGFPRFLDFMHFAEDGKLIRVDWTKTRERVYVYGEDHGDPIGTHGSAPSRVPAMPDQPGNLAKLSPLQLLDVLDKKHPYVALRFLEKQFIEAGYSVGELLSFSADGILTPFRTPVMHFADGTSGQADALHVNRDKPEMRSLYADNPSSWESLTQESKAAAMSVLKGLAALHPYITWNMVRTFLNGQDNTVNWDIALATAADSSIISLDNKEVTNKRNGKLFTVRAITVRESQPGDHGDSSEDHPVAAAVVSERKRRFWEIFRP